MVTRKPVAPPILTSSTAPQSTSNANPPYPTTPVAESAKTTATTSSVYSPDLANSPAFDLIDVDQARQRARSDSNASSHGTWDSDDTGQDRDTPEEAEIPRPLQIRPSQQNLKYTSKDDQPPQRLPSVLRPGPPSNRQSSTATEQPIASQQYEQESHTNPWLFESRQGQANNSSRDQGQLQPVANTSSNPYARQNGFAGESSQSAWQEVRQPAQPAAAPPLPPSVSPPAPPVELPTIHSPLDDLATLSLNGPSPSTNATFETAEVIPVPQQGQPPFAPVPQTHVSDNDTERPENAWWQTSPVDSSKQQTGRDPLGPSSKAAVVQPQLTQYDPAGSKSSAEHDSATTHGKLPSQPKRPLPSPISTAPSQPALSTDSVPETPTTRTKRQRNEHYQIKHINWYDASYTSDPRMKSAMRSSPILTQNANGPCPLLALVNALVLSTPSDQDTALLNTLHTREQVSLGLLLDAVFDELTSGRRGDTAHELPDVSDLYSFLLALHTGMNVNPRFVTPASTPLGSHDGNVPELNGLHPTQRAQSKSGAFEETREMRLYSTFNIPLIHGWTAPFETPAYQAFLRSAPTFEDAQNIQFAEAELLDKQRAEGLSSQEQQVMEDITTIKSFLAHWPTQLTDYGLETISKNLAPAEFAILFRNDHFSTIYKEPSRGALMTLVTDAGYDSHAEIVWESLVDVNGSASEMFSGDFRGVSHDHDVSLIDAAGTGNEWQSLNSGAQVHAQQPARSEQGPLHVTNTTPVQMNSSPPPLPGPRPNQRQASGIAEPDIGLGHVSNDVRKASEQEDHDLALALQLQEEEEDQQRQAEQRRRREQELSERFLSSENEGERPPIPPRRTGGQVNTPPRGRGGRPPSGRPPVNRPEDRSDNAEAPPSYAESASDRPYRPPSSVPPANPLQGNPLGAYDALRRQQSAYAQQSSSNINGQSPVSPVYANMPQNRRRSDGNRLRRSSQFGSVAPTDGMVDPVLNQGPLPGRVNQAAGVKDAEDKCVMM